MGELLWVLPGRSAAAWSQASSFHQPLAEGGWALGVGFETPTQGWLFSGFFFPLQRWAAGGT
jgi:hypothetical protein